MEILFRILIYVSLVMTLPPFGEDVYPFLYRVCNTLLWVLPYAVMHHIGHIRLYKENSRQLNLIGTLIFYLDILYLFSLIGLGYYYTLFINIGWFGYIWSRKAVR